MSRRKPPSKRKDKTQIGRAGQAVFGELLKTLFVHSSQKRTNSQGQADKEDCRVLRLKNDLEGRQNCPNCGQREKEGPAFNTQ